MYRDHRDLHVLAHSFPTRRSSDLAHHHGYVAGIHHQLLFDFLPVEHLDPDRLVREATARACRLDDDLASVLAFLASRGILRVRWRYQTHLRGHDHASGQSPTRKKINIKVTSRTHTLRQKRMPRSASYRSEEHKSELKTLMRTSYAESC